jgi:outer membrane protein OmpA-like peptidoglycan-associated protein
MRDITSQLSLVAASLLLGGCSVYSSAVNSLGPDSPVSDLQPPKGNYTLSEEPPVFCPAPDPLKPPAPIMRNVYFNNDTTDLTDESKAKIDAIYNDILTYPAAEILVVGHTDTQASDAYNLALSKRRAELIRQNLIEVGIDPEIITTQGRGETDLLVPTADNVSEVRNRRVVIDVH